MARRPKRPRDDQPGVQFKATGAAATAEEQPKKPLGKLLGAKRVKKQVFFVGGINPECTSEDIKNFCQPHCQLIECRMIPSRMYGTQSARLVVAESDGQLLETFSWPAYCYIRPWKFQKPSQAPMGTPEFTATPQLLTSQPCSSQAGAESS